MKPAKSEHLKPEPVKHSHDVYMQRALELAVLGSGNVSPNPLVGCVIVHDGLIIGEGWHKRYGEAHAEVNAISAVRDKALLKDATLYVTLEPCAHYGKTPPCTDLIVGHKLKTVVIANRDSNPLVAGKGIARLQQAGIEVIIGVRSAQAYVLNQRFFTYIEKKRPRVILKWAQTADGFIARTNGDSRWISDAYSRQLVHKWRSEEDAILVGPRTASHDNPTLNVRNWSGRNPTRVLIDRYLTVGESYHLFDGSQKTICYNLKKDGGRENVDYVRLPKENFIAAVVEDLYRRKLQSVIVEGGAGILTQFIESRLWDEARIFVSPERFGTGIDAPKIDGLLTADRKLAHDWLRIVVPR